MYFSSKIQNSTFFVSEFLHELTHETSGIEQKMFENVQNNFDISIVLCG